MGRGLSELQRDLLRLAVEAPSRIMGDLDYLAVDGLASPSAVRRAIARLEARGLCERVVARHYVPIPRSRPRRYMGVPGTYTKAFNLTPAGLSVAKALSSGETIPIAVYTADEIGRAIERACELALQHGYGEGECERLRGWPAMLVALSADSPKSADRIREIMAEQLGLDPYRIPQGNP